MKRSTALAPLSRDHQHALDAALRLRRADAATVAGAVASFATFFEREGRRHFAIEEDLLLPVVPVTDPAGAEAVRRVRSDHDAIRAAAGALAGISVEAARNLGERLHDHVRFEERVLFGLVERSLPAAELDRLGRAIDAAERG